MMKKCVIFGNSGFSRLLRYYFETISNVEVAAYTLNEKYISNNSFDGLPLIAFEKCKEKFDPKEYGMVVSLGYRNMNRLREIKMDEAKSIGYNILGFIHPKAIIANNATIGEGTIILENAVLSYGVSVGRGNLIWNGCQISHETQMGDFNYIAPGVVFGGETIVKSHCFFGLNSTVRGGNIINDYSLIGAGAYINNGTEFGGVYVPARTIQLKEKTWKDFF